MALVEASALAVGFGFRHGFDWDHIAALTDLSASQARPRRALLLASAYAAGHAATVLLLGVLAIAFAATVPAGIEAVAERAVGVSFLALAAWIVWNALRRDGAVPARSRWMVVIDAFRSLLRWARRRRVPIEPPKHGHACAPSGPPEAGAVTTRPHRHRHRHVAAAPSGAFVAYEGWSSFGLGALHGIGAETPTQVLLFATAANVGDRPSAVGLLVSFVVGLVVANSLVAAASTFGVKRLMARPAFALGIAAVTAATSLVLGAVLLTGNRGLLPALVG